MHTLKRNPFVLNESTPPEQEMAGGVLNHSSTVWLTPIAAEGPLLSYTESSCWAPRLDSSYSTANLEKWNSGSIGIHLKKFSCTRAACYPAYSYTNPYSTPCHMKWQCLNTGICDSLLRSHKASVTDEGNGWCKKTQTHNTHYQKWCDTSWPLIPLILRQVILSFRKDWPVILHRNVLPKVDEHLHNQ